MAQMKIVTMYAVKTWDHGLYERENCDKSEKKIRMLVNTEEEAKEQVERLVYRACFSSNPLEFNRRAMDDGVGVVFTSRDPKKDGYSYRIWYEPMDIVLN